MFGPPTAESLTAISSNLASLNLSGPSNGGFNFGMGSLVSTPASPSRLLQQAQSNSPYPQMPMMSMAGMPPTNAMNRVGATPTGGDKLNMNMSPTVSKEVEDEANSYFQRIYNHPPHPTLPIDELLDMLQRFQMSPHDRDKEVLQCMIRNLLEEYRFFPQYPDRELQITAQFIGGIVDRNIVSNLTQLGLALRYVLEGLRKEGTKMYFFGITALDRFKTKLHLYPNYSEYVKQVPHFENFPAHLLDWVKFGIKGLEPPNKNASAFRSNSVTGNLSATPTSKPTPIVPTIAPRNIKSIANATNINTLLVAQVDQEKFTLPPDAVQDKTAFIFNNLSQINMQAKCEELKEIMTKDYVPWLSQYMVLKRASIELNFHALYSNFLDALKNPDVVRLVTKETFRNIRVLLRSDKGIENFSDRSLLKNLGHWLGMMTLGRNRPILHIDLDLKSLLLEAFNKGQEELLFVVPFVAKVVESCAKSKVFKPPNPWTMGIMNVLGELHQQQNLKLNLKFEIEVLCKTLTIDIGDLKPGDYLKDPERLNTIEYQLSQPKKDDIQQHPPTPHGIESEGSSEQMASGVGNPSPNAPTDSGLNDSSITLPAPPEPKFNFTDITVGAMSNLAQHIVYSPNLPILHAHPQLKQIVRSAIERTTNDWLSPVVDRSVRIAANTCEQIVRKDFALEADETRMRKAAHSMVRNLTAGMAMITCRDQLNNTIQNHIKSAFATSIAPLKDLNEFAEQIANDNAELACAFIQKAAIEKAMPEIEKRLAADYDMRKLARQEGRQHYDTNVFSYQNARMPDRIRLKVSGISNAQFSVYDEFARNIPGFQPMTDRDVSMLVQKPTPMPVSK